jgi:hypothetical protein
MEFHLHLLAEIIRLGGASSIQQVQWNTTDGQHHPTKDAGQADMSSPYVSETGHTNVHPLPLLVCSVNILARGCCE